MNHDQDIGRRAGRCSAGVLGVLGSMACAVSMILAAVGVGGSTAAASMAAMTATGTAPGGLIGSLVRVGPWLMLGSVLLVTAAFALTRRPVTALPALLAGGALYAGMYAQSSPAVMHASIAAGYVAWAALMLWVRTGRRNPADSDHRASGRQGHLPGDWRRECVRAAETSDHGR